MIAESYSDYKRNFYERIVNFDLLCIAKKIITKSIENFNSGCNLAKRGFAVSDTDCVLPIETCGKIVYGRSVMGMIFHVCELFIDSIEKQNQVNSIITEALLVALFNNGITIDDQPIWNIEYWNDRPATRKEDAILAYEGALNLLERSDHFNLIVGELEGIREQKGV